MLNLMKGYDGELRVNGEHYNSLQHALNALEGYNGDYIIVLNASEEEVEEEVVKPKRSMLKWIR